MIAAALLSAVALAAPGAAPEEGARDLLLDVTVNAVSAGKLGEFSSRNGVLYAKRRELRELGLKVDGADDGEIAVTSLPGVAVRVDERTQSVAITAPLSGLRETRLAVDAPASVGVAPAPGLGAVANYTLDALAGGRSSGVAGAADLRLFGRFGLVTSGLLANSSSPGAKVVRLDTTYSLADPERLRRLQVGDVISGGLPYSRPVRLGGVQLSTDFGLRPDLLTFPLPGVSGQAAVPSTVDVLVNGVRQLSRPVDPGPFVVPTIPVVTGAGTVSVAVRDATGQQSFQTLDFYASPALLAQNLSSVSAEIGAVRRGFGLVSDDYGGLTASVTGRYGLNSGLTVEGHGEAAGDLALLTAGASAAVGHLGVASLALGASTSAGGAGALAYMSIERTTPRYRLSASAEFASSGYSDLAALNGDPAPRLLLQANGGVSLGRNGSLGVAYTELERGAPEATPLLSTTELAGTGALGLAARHVSLVSGSYSRELFGGVYLYATGYQDLRAGEGGLSAGVSLRFGARGSVNATAGLGSGGSQDSVEMVQTAAAPGEVGWRAYASQGADPHLMAQGEYDSDWGRFGLGVDRTAGRGTLRFSAQGAVVAMDNLVRPANTVQDSFAIVDTGGWKGVRVLDENREIGRTDAAGRLLIPDLRAYQANHVAIDPRDVPLDADVGAPALVLRPRERSGVVARFAIRRSRAVLVTLVDAAGEVLPVNSEVRMQGAEARVGYDGQVYLKDVPAHVQLSVVLPDATTCRSTFDYAGARNDLPAIGPFPCSSPTRPELVQAKSSTSSARTWSPQILVRGAVGQRPPEPAPPSLRPRTWALTHF